jgi:hypothetical protein
MKGHLHFWHCNFFFFCLKKFYCKIEEINTFLLCKKNILGKTKLLRILEKLARLKDFLLKLMNAEVWICPIPWCHFIRKNLHLNCVKNVASDVEIIGCVELTCFLSPFGNAYRLFVKFHFVQKGPKKEFKPSLKSTLESNQDPWPRINKLNQL